MKMRSVHVTPRLSAALGMLEGYHTVADIGCDHGRLTAALLQSGACKAVIASDISEPSLEKAKRLIRTIGLEKCVSFRVGDGLQVLRPHECEAIAILGMGGTLMCRILDDCNPVLMGASAVVLQPMCAQDDIRRYLHANKYQIVSDRIICDHGRLYQVLKAIPGTDVERLPDGFPQDFYDVGYRAFSAVDPLLPMLCEQQLRSHEMKLMTAKGTSGEDRLLHKIHALNRILEQIQ